MRTARNLYPWIAPAIIASPRKKWNTAQLLEHALEGAKSEGAKTRLYHLYDLDFSGCISCFACKRAGGKSYGHCAVKDDLKPVFEKIEKADAILIGSPIYISIPNGETRSFLERLIYPYLVYDRERSTLFPKKIRTAFIYTAGATDEMLNVMGVPQGVKMTELVMERIFGSCESFFVTDTLQFDDYSKYVSTAFDPVAKKKRHDTQFPLDCKKAYELGARLVRGDSLRKKIRNIFPENIPHAILLSTPARRLHHPRPRKRNTRTMAKGTLPLKQTKQRCLRNTRRELFRKGNCMAEISIKEAGQRLAAAFHLAARPLAVYGSETIPAGVAHLPEVNRCLAVSLYRMAFRRDSPAIYVGPDSKEGCCIGGLAHTGFHPEPDEIKWFVSTGKRDVRGGVAEYLKSGPEIVEACFRALGKVTPPGKYLVVQACEALPYPEPEIRSICCFGTAEQMRNMAALVHFNRTDPFTPVIVPWGPSCSTFITYPAGMTEKAPKNTAFLGPQDPTQNHTLPPDMMAIGIPAAVAGEMAGNLDASFIIKRPNVAFPRRKTEVQPGTGEP